MGTQMNSMKKRVYLVIAWLVLFPLALWTVVQMTYNQPVLNLMDLGIISLLAVIVSLFPIKVLDRNISFMSGINLAVFLYYGLTVALYMTLLCLVSMFVSIK